MSNKEFIVETAQIKKAIEIINQLEDDKFPLLLQRITQKLHLNNEFSFRADELEKLEKSFDLTTDNCQLVIDILEFIYLQAAYELIKAGALQKNLLKLNLTLEKANAIAELWKENGTDIIEKIRMNKTITHSYLKDLKWRLDLNLATELKTKQKNPVALFEFKLGNDCSFANKEQGDQLFQIEFSKEQLYDFYAKLEIIQKQIDSLNG
jgi:hypothetical protein